MDNERCILLDGPSRVYWLRRELNRGNPDALRDLDEWKCSPGLMYPPLIHLVRGTMSGGNSNG